MLVRRVREGRTAHMTDMLRYNFTHLSRLHLPYYAHVLRIRTFLKKILNYRRALSQLCRLSFDMPANINACIGYRWTIRLARAPWSCRRLWWCVLSIPLWLLYFLKLRILAARILVNKLSLFLVADKLRTIDCLLIFVYLTLTYFLIILSHMLKELIS